jgi:hypothetical protein
MNSSHASRQEDTDRAAGGERVGTIVFGTGYNKATLAITGKRTVFKRTVSSIAWSADLPDVAEPPS